MKTLLLFLALLLFSCFHAFSQNISINSKSFQEQAGVYQRFNYQILEMNSDSVALNLKNQIRDCKGIVKCDISPIIKGVADVRMITFDQDCQNIFINTLQTAGFKDVYIDNLKIPTITIFDNQDHLKNK